MKEYQFFKSPTTDRLVGIIMALAAETYILKDRTRALEDILERHGVIPKGAVEDYEPSQEKRSASVAERDAFVARILDPIIKGDQAASSIDHELVSRLVADR